MTFWVICEFVAVGVALAGLYLWKGSFAQTASADQLARARTGTLVAAAWAALVLIRLLMHAYA
jgi:hypothetical protein